MRAWLIAVAFVIASGCTMREDTAESAAALAAETGSGSGSDPGSGSEPGPGSSTEPVDPSVDASVEGDDDCYDEWCWDEPWDPDEEEQPIDAAAPDAGADATGVDAANADAGACAAQAEPACPAAPPGFLPQNPGIASGSQCRGACGANCPATCRPVTSPTVCLEWQTADCLWHAKVCTYPAQECGSHLGCRVHDSCYDGCATARFPAACRRSCDLACVRTHGARQCRAWMNGNPPYDSWLQYAGTPTSYTYDSTCY
jgi:hypothetical protein